MAAISAKRGINLLDHPTSPTKACTFFFVVGKVDCIHLSHSRLNHPLSDDMAQVLHLAMCKTTLAWIDGQSSCFD